MPALWLVFVHSCCHNKMLGRVIQNRLWRRKFHTKVRLGGLWGSHPSWLWMTTFSKIPMWPSLECLQKDSLTSRVSSLPRKYWPHPPQWPHLTFALTLYSKLAVSEAGVKHMDLNTRLLGRQTAVHSNTFISRGFVINCHKHSILKHLLSIRSVYKGHALISARLFLSSQDRNEVPSEPYVLFLDHGILFRIHTAFGGIQFLRLQDWGPVFLDRYTSSHSQPTDATQNSWPHGPSMSLLWQPLP